MVDLSLHVLDLIQNSVEAGAKTVTVCVTEQAGDGGYLTIVIEDDGRGMDPETVRLVTDPFVTSRKTRRVGMGLPLIKQAAEACGGGLEITSEKGRGTTVRAWFLREHIDTPPLGDIAASVSIAIATNPEVRFVYKHTAARGTFTLDSAEIVRVLGEVSVSEPSVVKWLGKHLREGITQVSGGESQ